MSDQIKHECGIALIRLLKPLEYYASKYGTSSYALNKLYLLMEKQRNRGQDGAGIACIKFDIKPGNKYISVIHSNSSDPIRDIFNNIYNQIETVCKGNSKRLNDVNWLKKAAEFTGELYLGHLRYGTFGRNGIEDCHPFVRENNWMTKNLVIAGNFNLTNVDELLKTLINIGQHPRETSDTVTILEKIGYSLDKENDKLYKNFKQKGFTKKEISPLIAKNINIQNILHNSCKHWDGGYVIAGLLGHGDAFVLRDPTGIRPVFYHIDDEVAVVASERPAIQTVFDVPVNTIKEIKPGNALIIKKTGEIKEYLCKKPCIRKSCSFERIYFSRGTDTDIYKERKKLGKFLVPSILKSIDYDIKHTVFSYIPNTASSAFYGLIEEITSFCDKIKKDKIIQLGNNITPKKLEEILSLNIRIEKIAIKDAKLRTFITQDNQRNGLVSHVYDITYGSIKKNVDNLVVIDDSIVRGTTLKQSILNILDKLEPKKIIIVSSAPQIRYPDCYGIDMSKLNDFIAFKAAIELLKDTKQGNIINEVFNKSKAQENFPKEKMINYVKEIYKPFTPEQISEKISELLTPKNVKAKVQIVFQSIEDLHIACPNDSGDWYFTGNYPTPGGNKVVNKAFLNYIKGKDKRAY